MSDNYRANFLWEHEDGSIEEAGYQFANGNTEEYVHQWWDELLLRVHESDQQAISQQRQTIDALTAALEQIKNIQSTTNDPATAANKCMDIATAALEKARGESSQQSNANLETPCVNCGSRTFVYLQSGKRQCVVCRD